MTSPYYYSHNEAKLEHEKREERLAIARFEAGVELIQSVYNCTREEAIAILQEDEEKIA